MTGLNHQTSNKQPWVGGGGGGGVGVCAGDKFVVQQNPDKRPSYDHVGWLNYCFTSTETVVSLGTGAQDVHLDFHTAPEL